MASLHADDWWKGALLYQIYPRSFRDSNGDGIGDLPGITEKLDYIKNLGADGFWISPFFRSPQKDFGYDISDYQDVDPLFGVLDDFSTLASEAHALGLKVMVDLVPAHCSDEHPWFLESRSNRDNPKADWFLWADARSDGTPPTNWLSIFGGSAWQWDSRRGQYYYHAFLPGQPNLNLRNPETLAATLETFGFWFDRGADGIRLDSITTVLSDPELRDNPAREKKNTAVVSSGPTSNPYYFQQHIYDRDVPDAIMILESFRRFTDAYPGRVLMGEVADVDAIVVGTKYTSGHDRLHTSYNFNLTYTGFDFERLWSTVFRTIEAAPDGWPTWVTGNHDVPRLTTRWRAPENAGQSNRLILAFFLTLRGCVSLYQGDELGLPEVRLPFELIQDPYGKTFYPEYQGRDGCRTPIPWESGQPQAGFSTSQPWLPVGEEHWALAVDRQEQDPRSTLQFVRRFVEWRSHYPALRIGSIRVQRPHDHVIQVERALLSERISAWFNFSNQPVVWDHPGGIQIQPGTELEGRLDGEKIHLAGWQMAFVREPAE